MGAGVDFVLFDLGGVLIRLGGIPAMRKLAGIEDEEELWRRWLTCPWVRTFESGGCSEQEFAQGVVADWELPISPEEYLNGFRQWVEGPLHGAEELVAATRQKVPVGCLSNTNALHWDGAADRWPLMGMFDVQFLSFQLGLVKPDRQIFEHAARALRAPPDRVLFLDDNGVNVEQAGAVGFSALRVQGVAEARAALAGAGVLPPVDATSP